MSIDLLKSVSRFRSFHDRETEHAWFRTLVPWIGPEAYLNVVYKAANPSVLKLVADKWRVPEPVADLLGVHNGAMLFSNALNIYGVVEPGTLLNRQDRFQLPPFNMERENESWVVAPDRLLVIGGYRFDGSRACIDRTNGRIYVFKKRNEIPVTSWDTVDDWLNSEVFRLGQLFDHDGKRIGPESETGPPRS
jgi:hypothetical protein